MLSKGITWRANLLGRQSTCRSSLTIRSSLHLRPFHKTHQTSIIARSTSGSTRKQFIIRSNNSIGSKPEDVFDILKSSHRISSHCSERENPGLVVLSTPAFATWLEDSSFMPRILECLFSKSDSMNAPIPSVETLLAVVDGISRSHPVRSSSPGLSTEGLSFMIDEKVNLFPSLWDSATNRTRLDQDRKSSLSLSTSFGPQTNLEVDIRLANTVFINGRTSISQASRWQSIDNAFRPVERVEKQSTTILYQYADDSKLFLSCPLIPLTPPRRILSGLGNIARRLQINDDKPSPASQELEASIDAYFKAMDIPKQTIAVWALVIPKEVLGEGLSNSSKSSLVSDTEHIRALWNTRNPLNSYVWDLLQHGGGLYRVLSGGGGWGMKQGLLSLDPEIKLIKSTPSLEDDGMNTLNPMDSHSQTQALGDIARPGSYIQFFVATNPQKQPPEYFKKLLKEKKPGKEHSNGQISLNIGCIPSRMDDMPPQESSRADGRSGEDRVNTLELTENEFDAQTESGMFMSFTAANGSDMMTKVDVPYAKLSIESPR